jgi:flagellin-like protein
MKLNRADKAVSDVIGTALLLGMTISLFSVLSGIVLSYPSPSSSPTINLVGTIEGEYLLIEHRGGESLSLDTKVIITIGDNTSKIRIGDENYLDEKAKADKLWGIGEWFTYRDANMNNSKVMISVVDVLQHF